MKFDIIETLTDIDDEFIASAKPVAQKPIVLRAEPRSKTTVLKKCAAAAACLAVLAAAGSVIAVKASNSRQAAGPLSSAGSSADNESLPSLPRIDLGSFYNSIQGIGRYLSHNDNEIYDSDGENVRFNVVSSTGNNGVKLFVGLAQDEYGLDDMVTVVAAVENTSDKTIGVMSPFSSDYKNGGYYNLTSTHSEIMVEIKNKDFELCDYAEKKYFLDDPHILTIEPGETYYQAMSYDTYYRENDELGGQRIDVPSGTYNGTASVNLVSDSGEVFVYSLDFDVNIAEWRACTSLFVNNGLVEESKLVFFDGTEAMYRKDGIYVCNEDKTLTKLYGGEYVQDWYMYDLNGDGILEIISTVTVNSEIGDLIYAYDRVDKQLYVLEGLGEYNSRVDRVNGRPVARKFEIGGAEISVEPLEFDMFKPCIIRKNGEPAIIAIDPNGGTTGEVPMVPIESDTTFGGYDDDPGFSN